MSSKLFAASAFAASLALAALAVSWFWLPSRAASFSALENVSGVPYPQTESRTQVYEPLAHADAAVAQLPLAKKIVLNVSFVPHRLKKLSAGMRENSFWLSYNRELLYQSDGLKDETSLLTRRLEIPLTDKLVDTNGTLDLMFFAENGQLITDETINHPESSKIYWELAGLDGQTEWQLPARAELKDFVKSLVFRERAL